MTCILKFLLMRLSFCLLNLLLFFLKVTYAQQEAYFEVSLYFEDALGHLDSVIVGYDPEASSDIDLLFGEEEINDPFDSIFEVRASSMQWPERKKLAKKIIEAAEPHVGPWNDSGCYNGRRIFIYIWAKHQPVKVYWDQSKFTNESCNIASFLADHWEDELINIVDLNNFPENYVCMATQDTAIFNMNAESILAPPYYSPISTSYEVEGLGLQEIYALRFAPAIQGAMTPCYWISSTSFTSTRIGGLSLYPNPTRNYLYFEHTGNQELEEIRILNLSGQEVFFSVNLKENRIDCSKLQKGIYQTLFKMKSGIQLVGRFIKI